MRAATACVDGHQFEHAATATASATEQAAVPAVKKTGGSTQPAVREVLRANRAVGSCVYRKLKTAVFTFPAVPRSTQPSTLCGTVNEYQLSG